MRFSFLVLGIFSTGLTAPAVAGAPPGAYFMGLGDLPGGFVDSAAHGVSDDGSVVVGMGDSSDDIGPLEAFRWSLATGIVGLGDLPGGGVHSWATGVSMGGGVIVGASESSNATPPRTEAFRWTATDGMVGLGFLTRNVSRESEARAVTADGRVIVGMAHNGVAGEAFRWTPDQGMIGLGDLPGGDEASGATDVSADGSVIVGWGFTAESDNRHHGFRWTAETGMTPLGDLPGGFYYSDPQAVSADGATVVGTSSSATATFEAFRWTAEQGMIGLGILAGGSSEAHAVSGDGSIVVGTSGYTAFIWDAEHGIRDLRSVLINEYGLDLTGWSLSAAFDITPDGMTMVGAGHGPSGGQEAWIVHLPEPSVGLLLVVAVAVGGLDRSRRQARIGGETRIMAQARVQV